MSPHKNKTRSATSRTALVQFDDVSKVYANGTIALRGLTLAVGDGEFLSLLGPSGCGKSTALRLVAGLGSYTAGRLTWAAGAEQNHSVGFVFQDPTLLPWATVRDNVALPLRLLRQSEASIAAQVAEALSTVGLAAFGEAYPKELSGGMKMRVSIARAIVTRPRILLMDEPFAALDEITRVKLNDDLLEIWRQVGCTVVFVTHSTYESVYLSNRVVVMAARPGRLIGEVTIERPYPRQRTFRLEPDYADYCRSVSDLLDVAMQPGDNPR